MSSFKEKADKKGMRVPPPLEIVHFRKSEESSRYVPVGKPNSTKDALLALRDGARKRAVIREQNGAQVGEAASADVTHEEGVGKKIESVKRGNKPENEIIRWSKTIGIEDWEIVDVDAPGK